MNASFAVDALAALAQETRLAIFRLLIRHAPPGLPAGQIARRLRLPGPTLSFHLNVLSAAELICAQKKGRSISYSPRFDTVSGLTGFLLENCCGSRGVCAPVEKRPPRSRSSRGTLPPSRKGSPSRGIE
jgi:DNA-binding transcriptional ArsR family regulator